MLKDKIINNKLINLIYKTKFYFDIGAQQPGWFTAKSIELMAISYWVEILFNVKIKSVGLSLIIMFGGFSIICFGYFMKRSGLYDTEVYVQADKNPINKEILKAARIIIKQNESRNPKV